jgi:methyl acetate hydrolase
MDASATDRLLERAVRDGLVPGVVAVAGDREGVLYEGAFGVLSVDGDTAVAPDTMFWLASMTKALVSVAALGLIERGELELEQPVAEVVPAFGALQVLEGFDGDTPRLREPHGRATVRQLLTHTAGPGYWFCNHEVLRYHRLTGIPDPSSRKLSSLFEVPLVADPGTRWVYGTSTDWLGLVIEAASGQRLDRFCAEHIFAPLGMRDATFAPTGEQSARTMSVHSRRPDGGLVPRPSRPAVVPEFYSGGAGVSATGRDYLRFMRGLLRGGELDSERVLRPETVELAFTDHLRGARLAPVIRTAVPELSNDIRTLPLAQGWGLGFHLVLVDIPGMRRSGTGDWGGLANCYFWIDRTTGIAGTLLTQVLPFQDAGVVGTAVGLEASVYAQLPATTVS